MVPHLGISWRLQRYQRWLQTLRVTARAFDVIFLTDNCMEGLSPSPCMCPQAVMASVSWAACCYTAVLQWGNLDIDSMNGISPVICQSI